MHSSFVQLRNVERIDALKLKSNELSVTISDERENPSPAQYEPATVTVTIADCRNSSVVRFG